jgi:hypothetical protein
LGIESKVAEGLLMTANRPSALSKRGIARLWRDILDWDQAINTDSVETTLENLERRVLKLELDQKVSHPKD